MSVVFLLLFYHVSAYLNAQPRIIGGKTVSGVVPYIASIRDSGWKHNCAGVIIDPKWLLTAAHCVQLGYYVVKPSEYEVHVGTNLNKHEEGAVHHITQIITHPHYDPSTLQNDIALLRMTPIIQFTDKVGTIDFGTLPDADGFKLFATGWGATEAKSIARLAPELQYIILDSLETGKCRHMFAGRDAVVNGTNQICAFGGVGRTMCLGDSGGPVLSYDTGRLVGIFSGLEDCTGNFPVIFARVEAYISWIGCVTGIDFTLNYYSQL